MAFIDWLRKQHEESARNRALFEGRPRVAASQAWGGYQDRPGGQRLMVRQPSPPASITLTEKDDGSRTKVTKWEPEKQLKVSALPPEPVMGPGREVRGYPTFDRDSFRTRGMGGFTGGAQRYDMGMDPGWSGVPRARAAPAPRRVQPRVSDPMNTRPGTVGGSLHHPASIANIGMPLSDADLVGIPQLADLRKRVAEIDRQLIPRQAAIPRQQMPPPRFVPRVDPSQFPTVQDRGLGTYDIGDPRVQMGGGFDWTGRALRENIGEDFRNIGERYTNWWQNLVEENKRKRQRGNY